jgi:hypothetical protein
VLCAQVGIVENINHEVFRSLLESQNSCALHLQVALSKVQCNLAYNTLEWGFPVRRLVVYWISRISLAATIPGRQR